jgi:hypothetical protein
MACFRHFRGTQCILFAYLILMNAQRVAVLSIVFIVTGFLGAGIKYWRWWPSQTEQYSKLTGIVCPLCPNIDGFGTGGEKFFRRTAGEGIFNAILALIIGWTVVVAISFWQDRKFH